MLGCLAGVETVAQNTLQWTTNHYHVTGTTLRAIRQSIDHARPGGRSARTDGSAVWKVTWRYRVQGGDQECRLASFTTHTTITMTLPAWNAPSQADEDVKKRWSKYYTALLRHEVGHAKLAQAAAEEIRKRVTQLGTAANCPSLKRAVQAAAEEVLGDYRERDLDYDRRTRHGVKDGAHFP